jgi:hypothetical protein
MTTSLLVADAIGARGMALATPALINALARRLNAIILFMQISIEALEENAVLAAGGERNTGANFRYCLIDQSKPALTVAALVRRRRDEFAARGL